MWIEETKNGKFKFVERYTDYLTGQKKRVSVTLDKNTAQSRKLAQRTLNEMISNASVQHKPKRITLRNLADAYQKEQKETIKQSTYVRNYRTCNAVVASLGEQTLVDRLTAQYIRERFLATGKPNGTLNERLVRFKAMIRWGYRNDMISDISFLNKIGTFKDIPHKVKIQDKFLEAEELKALLNGLKIDIWRYLTEFLALSGLRFGEAAALDKTDIDYNVCLIHVTKTFDHRNFVTTSTKTLCSTRDVYMQPELVLCCRKLNELMLRRKLQNCIQDTHGLFLYGIDGKNIHYDAYNKYLREKSMQILGKECTTHVMRHTHASLLLEKGISVDTISRRLGHEDSRVTKEIYLHITEKLKEKDNEQISKVCLF